MKMEQFFYEHPVFDYQEFASWKKGQGTTNNTSIHMALRYYVKRGKIACLRRALYAVIPPGTSAEEFAVDAYLIAGKAIEDAVLAYHTALEIHGLAYSAFERFTFLTEHKVKPFEIHAQWFQPVRPPKKLIQSSTPGSHNVGVESINRQGVMIRTTNIARTFVDVIDRIDLAGGLEEVCRSVENIAVLDISQVVEYCLMLGKARLSAKVGFFLEQRTGAFKVSDQQLAPLLAAKPKSTQYFLKTPQKNCRLIKKWNLLIPASVLDKAWEDPNADV